MDPATNEENAISFAVNRLTGHGDNYPCLPSLPPPKQKPPTAPSKPGNKKSFVWNYFRHPDNPDGTLDRSRTQCLICKSQLAFNASGTTTTMLNHLKSRHGDIAQREEQLKNRPGDSSSESSSQAVSRRKGSSKNLSGSISGSSGAPNNAYPAFRTSYSKAKHNGHPNSFPSLQDFPKFPLGVEERTTPTDHFLAQFLPNSEGKCNGNHLNLPPPALQQPLPPSLLPQMPCPFPPILNGFSILNDRPFIPPLNIPLGLIPPPPFPLFPGSSEDSNSSSVIPQIPCFPQRQQIPPDTAMEVPTFPPLSTLGINTNVAKAWLASLANMPVDFMQMALNSRVPAAPTPQPPSSPLQNVNKSLPTGLSEMEKLLKSIAPQPPPLSPSEMLLNSLLQNNPVMQNIMSRAPRKARPVVTNEDAVVGRKTWIPPQETSAKLPGASKRKRVRPVYISPIDNETTKHFVSEDKPTGIERGQAERRCGQSPFPDKKMKEDDEDMPEDLSVPRLRYVESASNSSCSPSDTLKSNESLRCSTMSAEFPSPREGSCEAKAKDKTAVPHCFLVRDI